MEKALAMLRRLLEEYQPHWHYGTGGEIGYRCDYCGVFVAFRSTFNQAKEHQRNCAYIAGLAYSQQRRSAEKEV